ncbi:hypothetical protein GX50_07699 [[Emmonsia] crescens]|uniref:Uncharacterized protein n=1 Tax=[Emmonsia] crescens TaxID=73230 RepID=A0A2B7Z9Q9_9EURO|nr:hypothetical protein GX50_07699 [Emmonsia crescens]
MRRHMSLDVLIIAEHLFSHQTIRCISKPEVFTSHAEIDVDESIPFILNAIEHKLSACESHELHCYYGNRSPMFKWAANGQYAIGEVGKKDNIDEKNIYDVAGKFCSEMNEHT